MKQWLALLTLAFFIVSLVLAFVFGLLATIRNLQKKDNHVYMQRLKRLTIILFIATVLIALLSMALVYGLGLS